MKLIASFLVGSALLVSAELPKYLAFQIFTGGAISPELRDSFPSPPADLRKTVSELRERIGTTGSESRKLGVVVGPLSFDQTDEQVRAAIAAAFDVALDTGVAVGFHIDDSMFWGRMKELNVPGNIEWVDWNHTPSTGRRLAWSAQPKKVMPELCVNSVAVKAAVSKRAALIGVEIAKGVRRISPEVFLGVIAGWETEIGTDFATEKRTGYCALTNAGYSATKPPADIDAARGEITREFEGLWANSLLTAGVPKGKVYSHTVFRANAPDTAFCDSCIPGLSTYPTTGQVEQWRAALKKHGDPAWASCEGTAADPGDIARSGDKANMEGYLASMFNHGAVLVNIFGWGIGNPSNPFRKLAESDSSLAAYRKFMHGETLLESTGALSLPDKIHKIQGALPTWIQGHGAEAVKPLMVQLDSAIKAKRFDEAEKLADQILAVISN